MIRVIVDTNVLISALLKEQSKPAIVVSLIHSDYCKLCLSKEIFDEYAGVIARNWKYVNFVPFRVHCFGHRGENIGFPGYTPL